jgi:probable rRNA maturation factor
LVKFRARARARTRAHYQFLKHNVYGMQINISNKQSALDLRGMRPKIKKIINFVLDLETKSCDEVSIFFVTNDVMCKMHKNFFDDEAPTDSMSFPIDDSYLGDLFVCPETALSYAALHNLNPYRETTLYIVHGLLHLLGYDDIKANDRKKMRQAEKNSMNALTHAGLVLDGT